MKKKLLFGIATIAIAVLAILNVNYGSHSKAISGIMLINIEALAQNEGNDQGALMDIYGETTGTHYGVCCCPGYSSCAAANCPSYGCQ